MPDSPFSPIRLADPKRTPTYPPLSHHVADSKTELVTRPWQRFLSQQSSEVLSALLLAEAWASSRLLELRIDGLGSEIATGVHGDILVPAACSIVEWTVLGDQVGSVSLDLWAAPLESFPPTSGNQINGSSLGFTDATYGYSADVSGWETTALTANTVIRVDVTAVENVTRLLLSLRVS